MRHCRTRTHTHTDIHTPGVLRGSVSLVKHTRLGRRNDSPWVVRYRPVVKSHTLIIVRDRNHQKYHLTGCFCGLDGVMRRAHCEVSVRLRHS